MTLKKNLKKRVRARQEKTGESYTTARMHVLNQEQARGPKVSQVSLREVTPLVEEVGLKGQAFLMPRFPESLTRPALKRLRELLLATRDEPATQRMRAVLLDGEPDTLDFASLSREWIQTQVFRGGKVARHLLGEDFSGFLTTDRWSAYEWVDAGLRQLCQAHLTRDFQGFIDRAAGAGA